MKNSPIPPGLIHDPMICRIDGIKITDLMGETAGNKPSTRNEYPSYIKNDYYEATALT